MYEIGRVYIWQNQVGDLVFLNGSETTVTGPPARHQTLTGPVRLGQLTDSEAPGMPKYRLIAEAGDLRPKNDPAGERGIMDLFKLPEVETA